MFRVMALSAAVLLTAAPALAAGVTNSSFVEPNGDRVLQLTIDIAAPPARVWKAFVDEDTLRHWNARGPRRPARRRRYRREL